MKAQGAAGVGHSNIWHLGDGGVWALCPFTSQVQQPTPGLNHRAGWAPGPVVALFSWGVLDL